MKYSYYMFEKELTYGNHVSYHFIYDYFDTISSPKSKLYQYEKFLKENISRKIDLNGFQNAITTPNTTLNEDAFHIGSDKKLIDDNIKSFFKINCNFPVIYFTKKISNAEKISPYKCGYTVNVLSKLNNNFKDCAFSMRELFKSDAKQFIFASHFNEDGIENQEELNVEIVPHYSKENFLEIQKKLLDNFEIKKEILSLYEKKFKNYKRENFHYHIKIKFTKKGTIVKFYRTYPKNPYVDKF